MAYGGALLAHFYQLVRAVVAQLLAAPTSIVPHAFWFGEDQARYIVTVPAAEAGLVGTRLYTNQKFEANIALYASLGYAFEREEELNGGVAVHMRKALAR